MANIFDIICNFQHSVNKPQDVFSYPNHPLMYFSSIYGDDFHPPFSTTIWWINYECVCLLACLFACLTYTAIYCWDCLIKILFMETHSNYINEIFWYNFVNLFVCVQEKTDKGSIKRYYNFLSANESFSNKIVTNLMLHDLCYFVMIFDVYTKFTSFMTFTIFSRKQ